MPSSSWAVVPFRKAIIYNVEFIAVSADAHQKIVRFDISMDKRSVVEKFNARNHLVGKHENSFICKPTRAK